MFKWVVIEVQVFQQMGQYEVLKFKRWVVGGKEDLERVLKGELIVNDSVVVVVSLLVVEIFEQSSIVVLFILEEVEVVVRVWGIDWMFFILNDEIKFVVCKIVL